MLGPATAVDALPWLRDGVTATRAAAWNVGNLGVVEVHDVAPGAGSAAIIMDLPSARSAYYGPLTLRSGVVLGSDGSAAIMSPYGRVVRILSAKNGVRYTGIAVYMIGT